MIEPLGSHYLIEVENTDIEKSLKKHNIKIDQKHTQDNNIGVIKAVYTPHVPNQLRPEDMVIFKQYGNEVVNDDDKEYLLVPEENIVGRFVTEKSKA